MRLRNVVIFGILICYSFLSFGETKSAKFKVGENFTLKLKPGVMLEMVWVEGGCFRMGSDRSDAFSYEKPVHSVLLNGFWIGKYEVTQVQYHSIMDTNPAYWKSDDLPVDHVRWNDCHKFINALNSTIGNQEIVFQLPSEKQWEYAARGGSKSGGFKYSGSNEPDLVAWNSRNSEKKTHPVGSKLPNELGIYDMSGNLREWCENTFYKDYSSKEQLDHKYDYRVLRGGGWFDLEQRCRVTDRSWQNSENYNSAMGFRLVAIPQ